MDSKQIPIGKAGCFGSLSSCVSMLIASGLKDKQYDKWLPAKDNLKLAPGLIQKFDFILLMTANN